jgi:aconitase A
LAEQHAAHLTSDPAVEKDPTKFYDEVIEIDLSKLEPHIVGPHSPDLARPVSAIDKAVTLTSDQDTASEQPAYPPGQQRRRASESLTTAHFPDVIHRYQPAAQPSKALSIA